MKGLRKQKVGVILQTWDANLYPINVDYVESSRYSHNWNHSVTLPAFCASQEVKKLAQNKSILNGTNEISTHFPVP